MEAQLAVRGIEVPPLLVIVALLAGEQIGGVAGVFLAVPVAAALKIILAEATSESRSSLPATAHEPDK